MVSQVTRHESNSQAALGVFEARIPRIRRTHLILDQAAEAAMFGVQGIGINRRIVAV